MRVTLAAACGLAVGVGFDPPAVAQDDVPPVDFTIAPGALFGTFNYQGDPERAFFYFKDIAGNVPDEFFVEIGSPGPPPPPPPHCPADIAPPGGDGEVDGIDLLVLLAGGAAAIRSPTSTTTAR